MFEYITPFFCAYISCFWIVMSITFNQANYHAIVICMFLLLQRKTNMMSNAVRAI